MIELRQAIIVYVFLISCASVFVLSMSGYFDIDRNGFGLHDEHKITQNHESYFKGIYYFVLRDYEQHFNFNATELSFNNLTGRTLYFDPKGLVFTDDRIPISYQARKGILEKDSAELFLEDEVMIETRDTNILANKVTYQSKKDELVAEGDVRAYTTIRQTRDNIYINSEKVVSYPQKGLSYYEGDVNGRVKRKKLYEESIDFFSDELSLDMNKMMIGLDGKVRIKKSTYDAKSRKGEIYLENYNKKLKYFVLFDDVKVIEKIKIKGNNYLKRRAFAEKLEAIMSENKIILTGYPKVFQGKDLIKGNRIILRENNEVIEVDDASSNFILQ